MASPAAELRTLLACGQVRLGADPRWAPPQWGWAELAGRYVELCAAPREEGGAAPAAALTAAVGLVRDAQRCGEPAAWITGLQAAFFPPDVAGFGVDLEALAVVRVAELWEMLRAADCLLRSGAFGLLVLDASRMGWQPEAGVGGRCQLPPRGQPRRLAAAIPLPVQVRLAGLAKKHGAALVCLLPSEGPRDGQGSLASLRVQAVRARGRGGRYRCVLRALKDKRRNPGWECEQVVRGPLGVR